MQSDTNEELDQQVVDDSECNCHPEDLDQQVLDDTECTFQPGDHVYQWCSFVGIPRAFQHHGIVLEVVDDEVFICNFSNLIRDDAPKGNGSKVLVSMRQGGGMQRTRTSRQEWKKVQYEAPLWKRMLWSSGSCTAAQSDPAALVVARARYLLGHPDQLPSYHIMKANCECVVVWCTTGRWMTLQASSLLHMMAAGQLKSTVTMAAWAKTATVTVPSAGIWGWLGYSTQVSLASTQPYLLPAIAGFGAVTVGGPACILLTCRKFWSDTTQGLNDDFWSNAPATPEVFVACISEWSR